MKKVLTASVAVVAALGLTALALAQAPPVEVPFPAAKADVFVYADTVAAVQMGSVAAGGRTNYFPQGSTVVFRAYAGDAKSGKVLTDKDVTFFYVTIPGQPNVKLKFVNPGTGKSGALWTGAWTVPADYLLGPVAFRVLVKTKAAKRYGSFQQAPVATAQLTVTKVDPTVSPGSPPAGGEAGKPFPGNRADVLLYLDTVNGSRPKGTRPRPIGCTQTSYFNRGEQLVFRIWGVDASTGEVLSSASVKYAYVKIPGQPNLKLNWGPHGTPGNRVWFWTAAFDVPADYPLGVLAYRVVFKTETDKFGLYDESALPESSRLTINP